MDSIGAKKFNRFAGTSGHRDHGTQISSNVLAGNDVTITAKSLDISSLDNTGSSQSANSDLKIGAFARVSSPLIDLVNNVEAARKSDGRLEAMQGMAAAANGYQSVQAVAGNGTLIKGEVGIGFASSSNSSNSSGSTAVGSTINGGGNVTLKATEGDLHATGATLGAGKTLALDAAQDIVLDASQSTFHTDAKNRSAGAEAGVGYSVGAQTGVYAYAAVNAGKGHSNSDGTIHNNTQLKADTITIGSQGDTTLKGAVATANTINVDVGGKLAIESLQDTTRQDSSQTNVGARVQVSLGTAWEASGNLSQQKGSGTSTAVGEQSGLFAGAGGYHVKADSVDLKGGAIASTNTATSELTTNTLTASNLENKMNYSASNVWHARASIEDKLARLNLYRLSPAGEVGYPGSLLVMVTYELLASGALRCLYQAVSDRATPVSISQHSYFNLAGHGDVLGHQLCIDAEQYLPVRDDLIPTGELAAVAGGPFDFRLAQRIGSGLCLDHPQLRLAGGYDHNFVLAGIPGPHASLADPISGRRLEIYTDSPGLQFYSGNYLDGSLAGQGRVFGPHAALCLEPQQFPDAPNHAAFPGQVCRPGQPCSMSTLYALDNWRLRGTDR